MKSIILSIACLTLSFNSFADYTRTLKDEGPNGFKSTSKVVEGDNTVIACSDPGWNGCPTTFAGDGDGDIPVNVQIIGTDFALNQINQGNSLGNQRFNIAGSGVFNVMWTSETGTSNSTIQIKVAQ